MFLGLSRYYLRRTAKKAKKKKKKWGRKRDPTTKAIETALECIIDAKSSEQANSLKVSSTEEVLDAKSIDALEIAALLTALEFDGEILLGLAFTTAACRRRFLAFPSSVGLDVTHGTKNEKRPLLRATGLTASNNIFPIAEAFLPSQSEYVFRWFLKDALPELLHGKALSQIAMILTDQDVHLINALMPLLSDKDSPYYQALHRLCKWHTVRRHVIL